jgi:monoamine oxidase
MLKADVAIVGGGLSGLYAAHLLEGQGIDYVLLEAREGFGGRLQSLAPNAVFGPSAESGHAPDNRFDLGATWYWPDIQPDLDRLVRSLGLSTFLQHEEGAWMLERSRREPPLKAPGYASSSTSLRITGGMASLVEALRQRLDPTRMLSGHQVQSLRREEGHVRVSVLRDGECLSWQVKRVLLALPPRLATHAIRFEPELSRGLAGSWNRTATWMAPHAKYVAVYAEPFWRQDGLAGAARSSVGPMGEIHDASTADGDAALFGFIAIPAQVRASVAQVELIAACRAQLVRLFGPRAAHPKADLIKDWASDPYTATPADSTADAHHGAAPSAAPSEGPWLGHLFGAASEWSPQFPGYVAGAIDAATRAVNALMASSAASSSQPTLALTKE